MKFAPDVTIVGKQDNYNQVCTHERVQFTRHAALAIDLVRTMCAIPQVPDGKDEAGDAVMRAYTVEEVVIRSCDIAAAMLTEFEKREWLVELPAFDELLVRSNVKTGF